jgi:uncharacterized membrane protein
MKTGAPMRWLRAACVLALIGLSLMVWSVLDPTPMPVMVSMTVGQVFGTLSLMTFLFVVIADMRSAHLERPPRSSSPPSSSQ